MDKPPIDHLDPRLWGKSAWDWIDALVLTYPTENPSIEIQNAYRRFFTDLGLLLPCPTCRAHHVEFLRYNPVDEKILRTRDTLLEFYFGMKNHARQSEGRPPIPSIDTMWQDMMARYQATTTTPQSVHDASPHHGGVSPHGAPPHGFGLSSPFMRAQHARHPHIHTTASTPPNPPIPAVSSSTNRSKPRRTGCGCGGKRI